MGSAYEIEVMSLQEFRNAVRAKGVGHASVVLPPGLHLLVGVGPQQIAQEAGVWDVCGTWDALDLLQRFELWREAPVHAQDLHTACG